MELGDGMEAASVEAAPPQSIWYARRLEAAKDVPVALAGMSELYQRRCTLAGPLRK
jgi:hypothetical protein